MACRECEAECSIRHSFDPYQEVWSRIRVEFVKAAERMPSLDVEALKRDSTPEQFLVRIYESGRQATAREGA